MLRPGNAALLARHLDGVGLKVDRVPSKVDQLAHPHRVVIGNANHQRITDAMPAAWPCRK
jgi:hypothetical protein